ncbi:DUF2514 family protein [Burkholderia aenigmatica]|uniref:DUF2514 family protein n=1 Tax=Burkholderia aenigmatica TaxID=2015348 RepID=UPI002653BCF4|nr:DUF2514 family protein [Burkholderia aenigmatica]MDN7879324.1 DUF2514 family protein [Burkholderia aenigmatica]
MTFLDPRVWLAVLAAVFIGSATGYFKGHADGVRTTTIAAQKAQLAAVAAARTEEQRRTAAQQESADHAAKERDQALADAAAANVAADGLRKQLAVYVERARHPAATAGSTSAGDPIGVLADVLGGVDDRAGELAAYADAARIAGQQCERDYDALTSDLK